MSLFSFFRKNKQEASSGDGDFYSRAEDESSATRARGKRKTKQSDGPADPVLPEKKRARRRLVGAIALVLAAIIGLPMILDSEPKPLAEDIAIRIPSKDQPRRLRASVPAAATLDHNEQIVDPVEPVATARAPLAVDSEAAANQGGKRATEAAHTDRLATKSAPVAAAKAEPKPVLAEPKAVSQSEPKVTAAPAGETRDDARAKSILEGKPQAKPDAAKAPVNGKSGKFMVQVAALASQEKINELRAKLKAAGIQSQVQKVATASGERTRIRVGPFTSREEADKMRARLAKLGLNGTAVPVGQ